MLLIEDKYAKMIDIFNKFVLNDEEFGTDENTGECYPISEMSWYIDNHYYGDLYVASGVSKAAIICQSLDYVLKIPFNGSFYSEYNDDDASSDELKFYHFEFGGGRYSDDYCYLEVKFYEEAKEYGVEKMFAKSELFGELKCGIPVYRQEKVFVESSSQASRYRASAGSLEKARKYDFEQCSSNWKALVIDYYGEEFLDKFYTFINDICPRCGEDLHSGNYGYTTDGRPVILDYSGWRD